MFCYLHVCVKLCKTCQNLEPSSNSGLNLMQKRRAIVVEMLLTSKKVRLPFFERLVQWRCCSRWNFLGWFLFVFWLPWVSCLRARSHVFYVLSTCTRRQLHVPHDLDLKREWESSGKVGNKTSGVADEIAAVRVMERRKRRSRDLLKDSEFWPNIYRGVWCVISILYNIKQWA